MSNITIDKIDEVIARFPSIGYSEAKEALVRSGGEVVEAIIYLEFKHSNFRTKKVKEIIDEKFLKDEEDLRKIKKQAIDLIKKSNVIRVIVEKNSKVVLNIPLTFGVVGVALGPVFALVGLSSAIICKYQIKIQNEEDNSTVNLGELNYEKVCMLKDMLLSKFKNTKTSNEKDEKDITDELIQEYDFTK